MPEKAPKSPIFARRCRAKWSAWSAFVATLIPATKSGEASLSQPSAFSPISALFSSVGVLGRSPSQIATQGVLGAYTGLFTAEKKKELMRHFYIRSFRHLIALECISHIFFFSVSNSLAFFNLLMGTNI